MNFIAGQPRSTILRTHRAEYDGGLSFHEFHAMHRVLALYQVVRHQGHLDVSVRQGVAELRCF
jgi:hypothetical protein